jgi:hypothetical protein
MSNTPKTTAIDWLQEKIQSNLSEPMSPKFAELFEEAREMEREQIVEAHAVGRIKEVIGYNATGHEYYNETYGKSE